jgi:large subunit ribosomal protein L4
MAQVIDKTGKSVRELETPAAFRGSVDGKANAIFRAVFRELANKRAGTASTKKRDEVRGGGKKPWKQKGTGRARQGSIRSPQWAHGGVVFGPQPRSYISSLNKKERRAAMVAALSDKFQSGGVTVLDTASFDIAKTKSLATLLFGNPNAAKSGATQLVVFATDELATVGTPLRRAGRNLTRVSVTHTGELDVKDVVACARLVLTTAAVDALAGKFAAQEKH